MRQDKLIRYGGVAVGAGVVGGMLGFFARGGWTADWVGAIGTWVGSLGAVAAIVWAVHTFQLERGRERTEREQAATEAANDLVRTAKRVYQTFSSGGGYLGDPGQMTRARLRVINDSDHLVQVLSVVFEDEEDETLRVQQTYRAFVARDTEWSCEIALDPPWPSYQNELENSAMRPSRRTVLTYRFDGRTWRCASNGEPERVH